MKIDQVEYEKNKWDDYFKDALAGEGQEHTHSLWWQISDYDTLVIMNRYLSRRDVTNVLEPGCGSGGCSYYLAKFIKNIQITFCDVSENALKFAQSREPVSQEGRVLYCRADATAIPFCDNVFDLTWNVGVIEHYSLTQILLITREMMRVTKEGGYLMVAIPNRYSIATLKAWLLGSRFGNRFLRWVPGYRFDSEILYGNNQIKRFLSTELSREVYMEFAGNMLWVGAPTKLVRVANSLFPQTRFSFLTFFVLRK